MVVLALVAWDMLFGPVDRPSLLETHDVDIIIQEVFNCHIFFGIGLRGWPIELFLQKFFKDMRRVLVQILL